MLDPDTQMKPDADDEDDYDELFEEDESDGSEFDLGPCLDPPSAKVYTTKELHSLIHQGAIDLDPAYQREIVWAEAKQMKLLDSIWRNYYVPPIVFAVTRDEDGEEVRCCVDGKQRLTSIQKFFDGQIPYKHPKTGKTWWYMTSQSQKKARLEVPAKWKKSFSEKEITCVEYHFLSSTLERDIFQRVQLGVALTAAEKLQAIPSPRGDHVVTLQKKFILHDNSLTQKIDVAVKRGQDFQVVAGLVYCCDQYPAHALPTSAHLEKWLTSKESPSEQFKHSMREVFTAFWHIANTAELNYGFKQLQKRVAPAEFVFTGVLLYALREETYEDRAEAIYKMRVHIREKFPDIRIRSDIVKELWNFIDIITDNPPAPESSKARKGKKGRKQMEENGMDFDEDYRPKKQAKRK